MTSTAEAAEILIADDDASAQRFLAENFAADGYTVRTAARAAAARALLSRQPVDLVLVDVNGAKLALLDELRYGQLTGVAADVPVLVLTSQDAEHHRIRPLERGTDDVQRKPYSYLELRLRVTGLLRRAGRSPLHRIRVRALELDVAARQAWIAGEPVHLSRTEFDFLRVLASAPTRTFTRAELVREIWSAYTPSPRSRTLDSHAHRLRCRLRGAGAGEHLIANVWGIGYRFIATPTGLETTVRERPS